MENVKCSCPSFLSSRGFLHILQVVVGIVTLILSGLSSKPSNPYWIYCMIVWTLCGVLALVITIFEMCLIDRFMLVFCIDWDDFTTGIAFIGFITTCTAAICYPMFYACLECLWEWLVAILAIVYCLLYIVEFAMDKCDSSRSVRYLAACPGIFKILEAYVSCILFSSVKEPQGQPVLIWCLLVYILPFPVIPVIIVMNVMKKVRDCLPFNLARFEVLTLAISMLLYITAAVLWPVQTLMNNPRPEECPVDSCEWNLYFLVTLMTYVNLALFTLELWFTLVGKCGFQRP